MKKRILTIVVAAVGIGTAVVGCSADPSAPSLVPDGIQMTDTSESGINKALCSASWLLVNNTETGQTFKNETVRRFVEHELLPRYDDSGNPGTRQVHQAASLALSANETGDAAKITAARAALRKGCA